MGNSRTIRRSVERWHREVKGKPVKARTIGRRAKPKRGKRGRTIKSSRMAKGFAALFAAFSVVTRGRDLESQ